ncbi:MAG: Flp pilus assembly complex ATPase component TadA, partial [Gammaproteobacteria bacterium]|nr:Flp pilus assembly complex ATPase component TadA [Gammaproteobacteria bacterium]
MKINQLIDYAIDHKATDLHLSCGRPPIVRIDGDLYIVDAVNAEFLEEKTIVEMLKPLIPSEYAPLLNGNEEIDLSITFSKVARLRVNIFRQSRVLSVALRLIPYYPPSLEELGLPKILSRLCQLPHGIILVTGPTGSGKSTSLA